MSELTPDGEVKKVMDAIESIKTTPRKFVVMPPRIVCSPLYHVAGHTFRMDAVVLVDHAKQVIYLSNCDAVKVTSQEEFDKFIVAWREFMEFQHA